MAYFIAKTRKKSIEWLVKFMYESCMDYQKVLFWTEILLEDNSHLLGKSVDVSWKTDSKEIFSESRRDIQGIYMI